MYLTPNKPSRVKPWLVRIAVAASFYTLGAYSMYDYAVQFGLQAYNKGFEKGVNDATWKDRALTDPNYSRRLCTAWWFESNASERKLK